MKPRSYRQAIAGALQALRTAVQVAAPSWELYTGHGFLSSVSIRRERSTVEGMEIPDLLLIVDRALALLCL